MDLPAEARAEIDKLYHGRSHVELTIGIRRDGKTETVHYGPDRRETGGAPLIYPVGSICKPFTASLTAKYVSEGKLDLDAPLSAYIKGLPERYYPSLRKLATHTSGYTTQPYTLLTTLPFLLRQNKEGGLFHTNPFRGYPDEAEMMKILRETKLKDKPYKFVYSNFAMSVLGYIAGQVSGKGFWDAMNDYIRDELKLPDTFIGNTDLTGYDKKENPCRCWQWEKGDIIAPAGALNSTMDDLLAFAKRNVDGSLPYLAMCHKVQGPCDSKNDSGLAWRLNKEMPVSWHTGAAGPYHAWLGINRNNGNAVAVGINYGLVNVEEIGFAIMRGLL